MEIEAVDARSGKQIATYSLPASATILDLKEKIAKSKKSLPVCQQELRPEAKGKGYADSMAIKDLQQNKVFVKNLGPQVGYATVFIAEYAGPLFIYLLFFLRPSLVYGEKAKLAMDPVAKLACACWTFHYAKRILETIFVHRFSHATMPLANLWRNCGYYWAFAAYVSWHINHPFFTAPSSKVVIPAAVVFLLCEVGNLSIHIALRNLRPAGSKVRKIPLPTGNPFTALFALVSCPNYTYEFGAWLSFSIMTSCLPAAMFCAVGMYQMTVWALGKHRLYKKDFGNSYPKGRTSILPFLF